MVHNDYLPSINPQHLCSALQLCSIRQHGTQYFVARHNPDKTIEEIPFDDIVDATTYE